MQPTIIHNYPNEEIQLFSGEMSLHTGFSMFDDMKCEGKAFYSFLPFPRVIYHFQKINCHGLIISSKQTIFHEGIDAPAILYITDEDYNNFVKGFTDFYETPGKENDFDIIHFQFPNLLGFARSSDTKNDYSVYNDLTFEYNDYKIRVEHSVDKRKAESLTKTGGHLLTGLVEISKTTGTIRLSEAELVMEVFSVFLAFLNGLKIKPLIITGFKNGQPIFSQYKSEPETHRFAPAISWIPHQINQQSVNDAWKGFVKLWQNENDQECIKLAIHWYLESLKMQSGIEASLVLVQNALELCCSWILVEKQNILDNNDDELSAYSKINILLTWAGISHLVPVTSKIMTDFAKGKTIKTGPELITHIRNKMVHPDFKNRKKYKEFTDELKYHALQLALHYTELILLRLINYNGTYYNRNLRFDQTRIFKTDTVPWVSKL